MRRLAPALVVAALLVPLAQPAAAGVAVFVEYLDVPPEAAAEFTASVTGAIRQRNLERLEKGEIFAWYHYRSRFPLGQASAHTDVLVTVFTSFASLESPEVSAGYARWVRDSEIYQGVPGVRSEDYYGKVRYTHVTVDFLTAGPGGADAFLATMRESVMPRLQGRADRDEVVNWALFARRLPLASARGYEYALVSRFDGFGRLETPQMTPAEASYLRRSEVWRLMEIVE